VENAWWHELIVNGELIVLWGLREAYHQEDILLLLPNLISHAGTTHGRFCNINLMVPTLRGRTAFLQDDYPRWLEKWLGPLPPLLLDRRVASPRLQGIHTTGVVTWRDASDPEGLTPSLGACLPQVLRAVPGVP
jgi:hypothetical protein